MYIPPEERRRTAEETLSQLPLADVIAYTDESVTAGPENDGAGVIWKRGRKETRIKTAAGRLTSSYFAELRAHNEACKYLEEITSSAEGPTSCVRICMFGFPIRAKASGGRVRPTSGEAAGRDLGPPQESVPSGSGTG